MYESKYIVEHSQKRVVCGWGEIWYLPQTLGHWQTFRFQPARLGRSQQVLFPSRSVGLVPLRPLGHRSEGKIVNTTTIEAALRHDQFSYRVSGPL